MSKDETTTAAADAPKKSKKMLMIIVIAAVVLLGGGGAGAFFMMKGDSAEAAPVKGTVVALDDAMTINLADGHYLKLNFSLQQTADAGAESVDTSEARELAIDEYTGKTLAELSTEKGREEIKKDLTAKIVKAYTEEDKKMVMGVYYTAFVTQ
ncbi:flagellar basal body-associated FliL family protein [Actinoplanes sp. Pm04-4]|jgi:flagellar protein FliL|uniref:Flagellar protein FliL n=1 Tax=Paractinoplanes pyxinae TaxID=2997416 RepID=A0ABT4BE14_9ACTN|nr:flagellar basal body-associated FliL family protein [Actinoplanes pyxinae]MCY1144771.1 flagellar basal body-associated FliL family protein [Actinoplanes pyxinae]